MDAERVELTPAEGAAVPRKPQFGLKALFAITAAAGVLLAVMTSVGPLWSAMLAWFMIMASAHVFANAWGSKHVGRRHPRQASSGAGYAICNRSFAPSTSLRKQAYLGKLLLLGAGAGAAIGGCAGLFIFYALQDNAIGLGGFVVATVSSAIVGGFAGFLAISFANVALGALAEASQDNRPPLTAGPE